MRGNAAVQGVPIVLKSKLDAAADTAANVTVDGVAGQSHVLVSVEYSYSIGTPVGKLQIKDGSTVVKEVDVNGVGHWRMDFSKIGPVGGIPVAMGADLVVELGAATGTSVGKLNITYR
jgi:hypothetical protein